MLLLFWLFILEISHYNSALELFVPNSPFTDSVFNFSFWPLLWGYIFIFVVRISSPSSSFLIIWAKEPRYLDVITYLDSAESEILSFFESLSEIMYALFC